MDDQWTQESGGLEDLVTVPPRGASLQWWTCKYNLLKWFSFSEGVPKVTVVTDAQMVLKPVHYF